MFNNNPTARAVLYYATLAVAVGVIALKHVPTGWAADAAAGGNDLIVYLGGLTGLTAGQNLTAGPNLTASAPPKA